MLTGNPAETMGFSGFYYPMALNLPLPPVAPGNHSEHTLLAFFVLIKACSGASKGGQLLYPQLQPPLASQPALPMTMSQHPRSSTQPSPSCKERLKHLWPQKVFPLKVSALKY